MQQGSLTDQCNVHVLTAVDFARDCIDCMMLHRQSRQRESKNFDSRPILKQPNDKRLNERREDKLRRDQNAEPQRRCTKKELNSVALPLLPHTPRSERPGGLNSIYISLHFAICSWLFVRLPNKFRQRCTLQPVGWQRTCCATKMPPTPPRATAAMRRPRSLAIATATGLGFLFLGGGPQLSSAVVGVSGVSAAAVITSASLVSENVSGQYW